MLVLVASKPEDMPPGVAPTKEADGFSIFTVEENEASSLHQTPQRNAQRQKRRQQER